MIALESYGTSSNNRFEAIHFWYGKKNDFYFKKLVLHYLKIFSVHFSPLLNIFMEYIYAP